MCMHIAGEYCKWINDQSICILLYLVYRKENFIQNFEDAYFILYYKYRALISIQNSCSTDCLLVIDIDINCKFANFHVNRLIGVLTTFGQ